MRRRLLALVFLALSVPAFAQVQPSGFPAGVTPPIFGQSSGVTGSGFVTAPQLLAPDGSASAPSYSFASSGSADNGMFLSAADVLGFSAGGTARLTVSPSAVASAVELQAAGDLTVGNRLFFTDVILSRGAADRLALASGDSFNIVSGGLGVGVVEANAGRITATGTIATSGSVDLAASNGSVKLGSGGGIQLSGVSMVIATAPTVTSAGTSPSIVSSNGTAAFRVNVGTGGTATTIVLAMPAATTGWNCFANNITAAAANRANLHMVQQSSTTTAATLQWQTVSTGAATAFVASDIVSVNCVAY